MKKLILLAFIFIVLETLFASSISIAVLDFEPRGINEDQAVIITDILRTELLKTGRITIVEREKIKALLKERQLSEVGVTESVELGKVLGVDKIIFGRIGMLGNSYVVTVRMIDVASGKVDFADQYTCQMTTQSITEVMKGIAQVVQKYLPPIEGRVALRKDDVVYITLSSKEGLKEGMELSVYRVEQVKDEEGNVIFEDMREIGKIKVLKVSEKGSSAKVLGETTKVEKGDVVKLPSPQIQSVPSKAEREKPQPTMPEKPAPKPQISSQQTGTGYLKITVENPELLLEAKLFIDEKLVSLTQDMLEEGVIYLENIPTGKRTVKITGPAIEDFVKKVEVKKDELVRVRIELEKAKGGLLIKTEPVGASITVDGRQIEDKTPTLLKLPVGRHEIVVSKDGFKSEEIAIVIPKGERKSISLKLEKASYVPHYYWIQDKKKVWIKGDWEDEKVLYVYYGAANGDPGEKWENGGEVFEFWDDFERFDRNRWKVLYDREHDKGGKIVLRDGWLCLESPYDGTIQIIAKIPFMRSLKVIAKQYAEIGWYENLYGNRDYDILFLFGEEPKYGYNGHPRLIRGFECHGIQSFYDGSEIGPLIAVNYSEDEVYTDKESRVIMDTPSKVNLVFSCAYLSNGQVVLETEGTYNEHLEATYERMRGMQVRYIGLWDYQGKTCTDYIFVTKYSPTSPSIEYAPEESGTWQIAGYTFTKRCKVIVRSSNPLKDFQIALDFSKFNDEHLMIVEEKR
ncbi:MAG: PEGA domain-containing protein [Candidatus Syntropharchaeia archaeon]